MRAKALQALRQLGFGEREAKGALSEACAEGGTVRTLEATLRAALQRLSAQVLARAS
jgi:Holliday junction resolvasome RuvABC DNA-binding subunit